MQHAKVKENSSGNSNQAQAKQMCFGVCVRACVCVTVAKIDIARKQNKVQNTQNQH